jgi:heat shock protein HslJ
MNDSFETGLTEAFRSHADAISEQTLKYHASVGGPHRRRNGAVMALAIFLALTIVGGATFLAIHDGGSSRPASRPVTEAAIIDHQYRLTSIVEDGHTTLLPPELQAVLRVDPGGKIGFDDLCNYHSGDYALTTTGITLRNIGQTLVWCGPTGTRSLVMQAVGSIDTANHTGSGTTYSSTVQAVMVGTSLQISTGTYLLNYANATLSPALLSGQQFRLTSIVRGTTTTPVPSSMDTRLQFPDATHIAFYDSCRVTTGSYSIDGGALKLSRLGSSLSGCADVAATRSVVVAAVDSIVTANPTGGAGSIVQAKMIGTSLGISTGSYFLLYSHVGVAPPLNQPSPTATR